MWWYNIKKFRVKPNKRVYAEGLKNQILRYNRVTHTRLSDMKACLASGFPIVGGFAVFESFMTNAVA
ncbi:MAG: peptidase, partial [Candidatus Dadabacteria bacterium]|nr:peptidase [Candidatus Dadabacteria bacterium]